MAAAANIQNEQNMTICEQLNDMTHDEYMVYLAEQFAGLTGNELKQKKYEQYRMITDCMYYYSLDNSRDALRKYRHLETHYITAIPQYFNEIINEERKNMQNRIVDGGRRRGKKTHRRGKKSRRHLKKSRRQK